MSYGSSPGGQWGNSGGGQWAPSGSVPQVKNWLVENIIALVCCGGGIFAILGIVFAAQVDGKLRQGDYEGATKNANLAKLFCIISFALAAVGLVIGLGIFLLMIIVGAAGAAAQ